MSKCTAPEIGTLLHAYELNQLSEKDIELFEVHLLDCDHCFGEVDRFGEISNLIISNKDVRNSIIEPTDEIPAGKTLLSRALNYLWPDTKLIFKPAIAYLAVALLAYPAYLGLKGIDRGQIRQVQIINLIPERSPTAPVVKTENDVLLNFMFADAKVGEIYKITILYGDDEIIYLDSDFIGFDEYGIGRLLLPADKIKTGFYTIIIEDLKEEPPFNRVEYSFSIEK